jgi:hypothetical protein
MISRILTIAREELIHIGGLNLNKLSLLDRSSLEA